MFGRSYLQGNASVAEKGRLDMCIIWFHAELELQIPHLRQGHEHRNLAFFHNVEVCPHWWFCGEPHTALFGHLCRLAVREAELANRR